MTGKTAAKWYAVSYGHDPEEVDVVKETEQTITILTDWCGKKMERRCYKNNGWQRHFRTKAEALLYIYEICENRLQNAKDDVIAAQEEFDSAAEALRKERPN